MPASIEEIYREYLRRSISLDDFREWLALNQWDLPGEQQELADEADVALVHLDDGYGNEDDLRARLAAVLERCTIRTVRMGMNVALESAHIPQEGWANRAQISRTSTETETSSREAVLSAVA